MTEGKEPSAEALPDDLKDVLRLLSLDTDDGPLVEAIRRYGARSRLRKVSLDFSDWCVDPWSDALEETATLHVSPEGPLSFRVELQSEAFEKVARQIVKESIETFLSAEGLWVKLETEGVRISSDEMGEQQDGGFLIPWFGSPGYRPMFDITTTALAEQLLDILADQYDAWDREAEAEVLRSVEPSQWVIDEPAEEV